MVITYRIILIGLFSIVLDGCQSQTPNREVGKDDNTTKIVGGRFENSDYSLIGIPNTIQAVDTSAGWNDAGQKILLTGTVYQNDGKTPAADIMIYYYQTNTAGKYVHKPTEARSIPPNSSGQTHGYIRGWVKTDKTGAYAIYTVRPGTYPSRDEPAHVHISIKEPNLNEYYIDSFVFDDDKLLTGARRKKLENRAGSGVLRLVKKDGLLVGEREIILGLNIPDYPIQNTSKIQSGKSIGEDVFSFTPYHAWGPDKGTKTCPVCKYGWYHGILYFVGNQPNWSEIKKWLIFLELESEERSNYLKVYFIYGNEKDFNKLERELELAQIGKELGLVKVALTFVPSFSDTLSEINLNAINQTVGNTMILYKRSTIIEKYIDLKPNQNNFNKISKRLDETINAYFYLR